MFIYLFFKEIFVLNRKFEAKVGQNILKMCFVQLYCYKTTKCIIFLAKNYKLQNTVKLKKKSIFEFNVFLKCIQNTFTKLRHISISFFFLSFFFPSLCFLISCLNIKKKIIIFSKIVK